MEAEIPNASPVPHVRDRLLSALVPVLLISIGYVDPGKWAAAVDGGARFGHDLVALVFVFNLAAIFCQYSSARIGVVTGKSLAQICSNEYDAVTCVFLGVQAELSIIVLDLTMVLGIAHGINLLFGVELFTCIFLTAVDAILFPIFATCLEKYREKFTCICIAGFVFIYYVFAVLLSQPDFTVSFSGTLMKLNGETVFALMSLLGANIMPHNFYLHSSIVKKNQGPSNISKGSQCHDHFFAIFVAFSGIFTVHYILMVSAANVFYSNGLTLLTFQDAMTLMDQIFRSPVASFGFLLVLYLSNQITALTWNIGGHEVLLDFIKMEIPVWLHRVAVRVIVVLASLYCLWCSGAEGMYQLLIFTQVMVALLLPSSVIPLFRVATSRQIMGIYKVSQFEEFLAQATFIGMLGLKLKFLLEMIFGNSDWVANLRWNLGTNTSIFYVFLLITACFCLCLMLWLLATPLKSASAQIDTHSYNWDIREGVPKSFAEKDVNIQSEGRHVLVESVQKQELLPAAVDKAVEAHSDEPATICDVQLPETIMESEQELRLTTEEETFSDIASATSRRIYQEESVSAQKLDYVAVDDDLSDAKSPEFRNTKNESVDPVEKPVGIVETRKENEMDSWESEKSFVAISSNSSSLTSDGPGSFKSISGKIDESGNGPGSLSRLAGLGRAARRQLAAVLDEFWGQLYDYHGQATSEAKAKKLDVLLGAVQRPASSSPKVDMTAKEFTSYLPTVGGRGSDLTNFSLYESSKKLGVQNSTDPYGTQRGPSSSWSSSQMRMLGAYVHNSNSNAVDYGERRYSSVRLPPSSDGWDYQPATIHGYQMASYRAAKEKAPDRWNGRMEAPAPKSPSLGSANFRDSLAFGMGQKLQNGLIPGQVPGYGNPVIARNSSFQSESMYSDAHTPGLVENLEGTPNAKKYYSLPDISGLAVPRRDLYTSDRNTQWGSHIGPGSSVGRVSYGTSLHSNTGPRVGAPLAFDELSPRVYRGPLSLQMTSSMDTSSLWSRQPSEQFGVADNNRNSGIDGKAGFKQNPTNTVDLEAKLLRSFRHCIVKLLQLEGSDWLFRQGNGVDEDLIDRVAAREKFLFEAEIGEINRAVHMAEPQSLPSDRKFGSASKIEDSILTNLLVSSVPHCGEGCIWKADLVISFGVWCIHRVLDLSLMESRPELWGKYTYVLNRLQGVIDPAFSKPRTPMAPCFCLQIPSSYQQRSSPPVSNGLLPPAAKPARNKCTTAATLLDIIKDVEIAISCRKGKSGTLAGDVAFPKGKENLVSVLKRYKRKLTNKLPVTNEGSGLLKV